MAMWPFGRKGRRSSRLKAEGAQPVAEGKRPAGQALTYPLGSRQGVNRKLSKRNSQRIKRRTSVVEHAWEKKGKEKDVGFSPMSPIAPMSPFKVEDSEKRPFNKISAEDITALPISKELRTSPHLRPATREAADIPYNFRLTSTSHSSIPTAKERGKLQRDPSRNKRAANDSPLPRRISSKKRKDDHIREEEIRAMSVPYATDKQPGPRDSGILRRDSRKMRGGLNRHFDRPMSNVSLPLQESIDSSMSGNSDTRAYQIGTFGILTPRPTIRYSVSGQYASISGGLSQSMWASPSRTESRTRQLRHISSSKDVIPEGRTIDDLADNLDAGGLRELMERDQRRREKRRQTDADKLQRKLERRAEKQRAKELKREQEATQGEPRARTTERGNDLGLGIATTESSHRPKELEQPGQPKELKHIATTEDTGTENTGTYLNYPPQGHIPENPFESDAEIAISLDGATPRESPSEEPVLSTAQAVRYSQANISPPTSPVQAPAQNRQSGISQLGELAQKLVADAPEPSDRYLITPVSSQSYEPPTDRRRSSEASSRRVGGWASFFKRSSTPRGRKSSEYKARSGSQPSFANTSRESMSRHAPPVHLVTATKQQSRSGTPVRTMSKFREDLPELPLSPPDSRVQSPEVTASGARAIAARRGNIPPSNLQVGSAPSIPSEFFDDAVTENRTDSPVSPGARASNLSNLMSQSLASVDSEGSWLSGRPAKRGSSQLVPTRNSVGSGSIAKHSETFSASWEELGLPDDEYFQRLTPNPDDQLRSGHSSGIIAREVSSTAVLPSQDSDTDGGEPRSSPTTRQPLVEETVVHSGAGRQPTVVHHQSRVKSSEGLLKMFEASGGEVESANTSPATEEPEKEGSSEDTELDPPVGIQRAKSVDLGKQHARQVSAGSAVLLDIPAKRQSTDPKHGSIGSLSDTGIAAGPPS